MATRLTRRKVRLKMGFCSTFKCDNKARLGKKNCQDCADSAKAEREVAKANGFCIVCIKKPICSRSTSKCQKCLDRNRDYLVDRREELVSEGICDKCRKRTARPDSGKCEDCSGNEQLRNSVYAILDLQSKMDELEAENPLAAAEARARFEGLIADDPDVLSLLESYEGRWRERRG